MPPHSTDMTEYQSATDIFAAMEQDDPSHQTRPRQETGDLDLIRYTMSSLQLDDYAASWNHSTFIMGPNFGGLAGSVNGASSVGLGHLRSDQCPQTTEDHVVSSVLSTSSLAASRNLVKAVTTLQRVFRAKKLRSSRATSQYLAATKIQAVFRSFKARKETLMRLNTQNSFLQNELCEKDAFLARTATELQLRNGMVDQLGKTIETLRRQITDASSSYEIKLELKEKQIEQMDRELQIMRRTTNDLKYRLESNAVEYAKMAWDLKEKDSDGGHQQYILALQRDLEATRTALSELRSTKEADGIRLTLKDKEITELRFQMKEVRRALESEIAAKNGEIEDLRRKMSAMGSGGQIGDGISATADIPARAPSVASLGPSGTGSVKSIWSSSDNGFVLFSHDVPREQTAPDSLYSNGSSKSSTPVIEQLPIAPTTPTNADATTATPWNPITCDLDFLNSSPALVPLSAEALGDAYSDLGLMGRGNDFSILDNDELGYGRQFGRLVSGQTKDTAANFYYLVDKIVRTNDQPASLLLQQKLKTATPDTKALIFDAIHSQSLSLIKNRFGNFLMQRVLEFGTPQQIRMVGQTMKGNVLGLACDRFGCHVVQKALDTVPEDIRTHLIHELLLSVRETLIHRFACHVWQRIFQIRWSPTTDANGTNRTSGQQIMQYLDGVLRGQWHTIANDENGSLVVQCIFENCGAEKSGVLREVLGRCVEVARGQWGNWVIQHILEHGSPIDRSYVLKVLIQNFYPMAIDQYASKVVEKGLKLAPKREMYEMIETVLVPSRGDGRPPLLEMMNNQYANYVVQHILNLADPLQKDTCIRLILPHISTLRNSKYGQRVAAIVEKTLRNNSHKYGGLSLTSVGSGLSTLMMGYGMGLRG